MTNTSTIMTIINNNITTLILVATMTVILVSVLVSTIFSSPVTVEKLTILVTIWTNICSSNSRHF